MIGLALGLLAVFILAAAIERPTAEGALFLALGLAAIGLGSTL